MSFSVSTAVSRSVSTINQIDLHKAYPSALRTVGSLAFLGAISGAVSEIGEAILSLGSSDIFPKMCSDFLGFALASTAVYTTLGLGILAIQSRKAEGSGEESAAVVDLSLPSLISRNSVTPFERQYPVAAQMIQSISNNVMIQNDPRSRAAVVLGTTAFAACVGALAACLGEGASKIIPAYHHSREVFEADLFAHSASFGMIAAIMGTLLNIHTTWGEVSRARMSNSRLI
jgi:hypothetical protein